MSEVDDQIFIPNALDGEYSIQVIPEPWANPDDRTTIRGSIEVWVKAKDNCDDIEKVEIYCDGYIAGTGDEDGGLYRIKWDEKTGLLGKSCTLEAIATDIAGNSGSDKLFIDSYINLNSRIKTISSSIDFFTRFTDRSFQGFLQNFLQSHPNMFPILRQIFLLRL